jgi:hypothetical protein
MSQATEPREGHGVADQRAQRKLTSKVGATLTRRTSRATVGGAPGRDDAESAAGPKRERVQASASPAAAIMTSRIEASRKHGRFDSRWPKRRLRVTSDWGAAAAVGLEAVPDGLDWVAFSRRYFPGRRRHDLEAISAYHEYQHGRRRESMRPRSRRAIGLDEPLPTTAGGAPRVRRASLSRVGATR